MLTVLSVLRSGGIYDAEWVRKLRDGVARHMSQPHRFVCLSDVPVPCERIPLRHGWPGWWSKIELFRADVVTGPAIFFDLDNVAIGPLDALARCPHDFAMLRNFNHPDMPSACVMWWGKPQSQVYEKFSAKPDYWISFHEERKKGAYLGDQAFVWDCFERKVPFIEVPRLKVMSYRKDYQRLGELAPECAMVAFGGQQKPHTVEQHGWLRAAWA